MPVTMGISEPPPSRHLVAFGDLLLDGHLRVRELGVELSQEVLEGLRPAQRLTKSGEGDGDVRSGELVDQAQIPWDPDLDEAASKAFVLVCRHELLPGWFVTNSTELVGASAERAHRPGATLHGQARRRKRHERLSASPVSVRRTASERARHGVCHAGATVAATSAFRSADSSGRRLPLAGCGEVGERLLPRWLGGPRFDEFAPLDPIDSKRGLRHLLASGWDAHELPLMRGPLREPHRDPIPSAMMSSISTWKSGKAAMKAGW